MLKCIDLLITRHRFLQCFSSSFELAFSLEKSRPLSSLMLESSNFPSCFYSLHIPLSPTTTKEPLTPLKESYSSSLQGTSVVSFTSMNTDYRKERKKQRRFFQPHLLAHINIWKRIHLFSLSVSLAQFITVLITQITVNIHKGKMNCKIREGGW